MDECPVVSPRPVERGHDKRNRDPCILPLVAQTDDGPLVDCLELPEARDLAQGCTLQDWMWTAEQLGRPFRLGEKVSEDQA